MGTEPLDRAYQSKRVAWVATAVAAMRDAHRVALVALKKHLKAYDNDMLYMRRLDYGSYWSLPLAWLDMNMYRTGYLFIDDSIGSFLFHVSDYRASILSGYSKWERFGGISASTEDFRRFTATPEYTRLVAAFRAIYADEDNEDDEDGDNIV